MNEIWYQYTYIKMGEIAQRISNICGTKELSARPMKNMNDLYMKNRLMESDSYDPGYFTNRIVFDISNYIMPYAKNKRDNTNTFYIS